MWDAGIMCRVETSACRCWKDTTHNNRKGEDRTTQNGIVEEEGTISDKEGTASLRIEEQGSTGCKDHCKSGSEGKHISAVQAAKSAAR